MEMPGKAHVFNTTPLWIHLVMISVVVLIMFLPPAVGAADTNTTSLCETDQFGNLVCPIYQDTIPPASEGEGLPISTEGLNPGIGRVMDMVPAPVLDLSKSLSQWPGIAGLGIQNSINQTREWKNTQPGGTQATGGGGIMAGEETVPSGIQEHLVTLSGIALYSPKSSIYQALHAEEYPDLNEKVHILWEISPEEAENLPYQPNILRMVYRSAILDLQQYFNVTTRGFTANTRNTTGNITAVNRSGGSVQGAYTSTWVPEDLYVLHPDHPAPKVTMNITPANLVRGAANLTALTSPTPVPTPTPVPPPVYNLSVYSDPQGALITLNGNRTGTTPYTISGLLKGKYIVNLTRYGYLPYGEVVDLESDFNLSIPLTSELEALFVTPGKATGQNKYGGLYITSFPSDLEVSIDGIKVKSKTPFLYYGYPEGRHTVRVVRADKSTGALGYTRTAWVYHDALTVYNIDTEEALITKRVSINAGPYAGNEFTINGRYPSGKLPATITAGCPGSFIGIRKGDEYTSFLIPCTNEDTVSMTLAKPRDPYPALTIESMPEGVEIFMDGFRTGYTTPHTFTNISGALHRVMLSKPGLYPVERVVVMEIRDSNSTPQREFFPMENYGDSTIVIDSIPPGADIYLNAVTPGEKTPHVFDHMKIGFYEVVVQMGSKRWIEQFELTPGTVSKVVANFNI